MLRLSAILEYLEVQAYLSRPFIHSLNTVYVLATLGLVSATLALPDPQGNQQGHIKKSKVGDSPSIDSTTTDVLTTDTFTFDLRPDDRKVRRSEADASFKSNDLRPDDKRVRSTTTDHLDIDTFAFNLRPDDKRVRRSEADASFESNDLRPDDKRVRRSETGAGN